MAIVKKGGRNIVVDGNRYRWRVRRKPTYDQEIFRHPISFSVEQQGGNGSVLVVLTPQEHPKSVYEKNPSPILPSFVAQCIRQALATGWIPEKPGAQFMLDLSRRTNRSP
jgi:hypothetical protein